MATAGGGASRSRSRRWPLQPPHPRRSPREGPCPSPPPPTLPTEIIVNSSSSSSSSGGGGGVRCNNHRVPITSNRRRKPYRWRVCANKLLRHWCGSPLACRSWYPGWDLKGGGATLLLLPRLRPRPRHLTSPLLLRRRRRPRLRLSYLNHSRPLWWLFCRFSSTTRGTPRDGGRRRVLCWTRAGPIPTMPPPPATMRILLAPLIPPALHRLRPSPPPTTPSTPRGTVASAAGCWRDRWGEVGGGPPRLCSQPWLAFTRPCCGRARRVVDRRSRSRRLEA